MARSDEADGEQFWEDLNDAVGTPCATHERIDDTLRTWLDLVSSSRDQQFLASEMDIARCSQKLLMSPIFASHCDYVRTQIIYSLLQEDDSRALHVIANLLLLDGRSDEAVFQRMIDAGCFSRLVDLLKSRRDDDRRLHRLLLELMYEMSRLERVRIADLLHVDDGFIIYLFQMVESVADEMEDPYHYPVIRVLLVLNEQYMVAATAAAVDPMSPTTPVTNRVVKILSLDGPSYRTFGENIILLLNRETETSLQLLILKLLYLLFTTKPTYEYFYTNDLRVLLDVIIRNLLDLPNESTSLRHTYLRVMYPLLAHTQLSQAPHYKRGEILRVLASLGGNAGSATAIHFAPADETTLRLVERVSNVEWLTAAPTPPAVESMPASPSSPTGTIGTSGTSGTASTNGTGWSACTAPTSMSSSIVSSNMSSSTTLPPLQAAAAAVAAADGEDEYEEASDEGYEDSDDGHRRSRRRGSNQEHVFNKFLGISLSQEHGDSCESVLDVAAVKEKPGVKTPSRKAEQLLQQQQQLQKQREQQRRYLSDSTITSEEEDDDEDDEDEWNSDPKTDLTQSAPNIGQTEESSPELTATTSNESQASSVASKPTPPEIRRQLKPKPKRALPAVPKHRHGVLMKPQEPAAGSGIAVGGPGAVNAAGIKKMPPKAPPPRRGGRTNK